MIDATLLTADLKKLVLEVEDDLRARVDGPDVDLREDGALERWRDEYAAAQGAGRTAWTWTQWRDDRVTQAAVAWVLTTVFVRFCEDNTLLKKVWIAGPAERRQHAQDARTEYFQHQPTNTDREWLLQPIEYLREVPATRDLVGEHSALWTVAPSGRMAQDILAFWHEQDDQGGLRRDFSDPQLSTRFLGDLYENLSEHAQDLYALRQTPEFVEEFILDRTLTPALRERSLEGFRLIDPTCGSGHFLLGAFHRLVEAWRAQDQSVNDRVLVQRALDSVVGVDINPYAVSIARFRLLLAAMAVCKEPTLENAPGWTIHVASGDSLLPWDEHLIGTDAVFSYATEDPALLRDYLGPASYDVVVGNPPYITVKDKALNAAYRERYSACKGTYALTVPFMQRFFALARRGREGNPAGWVGQITSNSFMKREFGSRLIEEALPRLDLRLIVDTSGAYIPGHGTPTVILVGRHQAPIGDTARAVLGIRGEPGKPEDPSQGLVWRSIVEHVEEVGHEDSFTSTADVSRSSLAIHPWSLAGGGADALLHAIDTRPDRLQSQIAPPIGGSIRAGADGAFMRPLTWKPARRENSDRLRPLVMGDVVRDWSESPDTAIFFPYTYGERVRWEGSLSRELWAWRTLLANRGTFQGVMADAGLHWWEYMQFTKSPYRTPLSIAFAFVATHNHFVLDRGGKVFNRSAPVIKLPEGASEDDHLALLSVLNSSAACFWLKQNSHNKGNGGIGGGIGDESWEPRYEFTGTTLQDFPLPAELPVSRARKLDAMATTLAGYLDSAVPRDGRPMAHVEARMADEEARFRARMIAVQEELDWEVYGVYGLLDASLTLSDGQDPPEVFLGERAFEIALARKIAAGEESSAWFERHGSTPITEIPQRWPQEYRDLVQRRLDLIASDRFINLLERPEYKRRWASEPWEKRVDKKLREWLLDRLEDRRFWFDSAGRPKPTSIAQLADEVARDDDLRATLDYWANGHDVDVTKTLEKLLADEAVPYLAALRLKEPGLRKRREWERTWELQRAEDRGEHVGDIPVPPTYKKEDFRAGWQHRGKLDVPKERFISYPGGGRDTDPSTLLGWAGWDDAQQSLALATILSARVAEGASDEKLTPLVAGMAELEPWVDQWHSGTDEHGIDIAAFCRATLDDHLASLSTTRTHLLDWRPPATTRGRRRKTT